MLTRYALTLGLLAATPIQAATLVEAWEFNGTVAATNGGPAAVLDDPSDLTATGVSFAAGDGISITSTGLGITDSYSVEMRVQLENVTSYVKLVDFSDLSRDKGLYAHNSALEFYTGGTSVNRPLAADTWFHLVLQRNGATGLVEGYVNSVLEFSFTDAVGDGIFTGSVMSFMKDDIETAGNETSNGILDYIRLYDGLLNVAEVTALDNGGATVPLPASAPLLLAGLGGIAALRRRRRA